MTDQTKAASEFALETNPFRTRCRFNGEYKMLLEAHLREKKAGRIQSLCVLVLGEMLLVAI